MELKQSVRFEELNGEFVVLDIEAGVVHRIAGETAEALRSESDPMTRRRMIQAAVGLGVAAGVTTLVLPSAAAAASGVAEPEIGSSYYGYAGDSGVTKPTNVLAVGGDSQATVTWTEVSGATGYRVYKRVSGETAYTLAWKGTGGSAVISPLTNDTTYQFVVVTVKNGQVSTESTPPASATPSAPVPGVPTNLGLNYGLVGGFAMWTLSWSQGSGVTPTGYYVEYETNWNSTPGTFSGSATVSGATSLMVSGGTEYVRFRVAAYTATKTSDYSAEYSSDQYWG